MFKLSFNKSRSKNYNEVLKIVSYFTNYIEIEGRHTVEMSIKELFQKWEFFNLLFWRTVGWRGSTFSFDNIEFYSYTDRTSIFYALQQSHSEWINMYIKFSSKIYQVYKEQLTIEEARNESLTENEINRIIDKFQRAVGRFDYYKEFGHLNFEAPLANSDFPGRHIRKKLKENQETQDNKEE